MPDVGNIKRFQSNAALQWQATPSLQLYADGLYTSFNSTTGFAGFNPQPFTNGSQISDITVSDYCIDARFNANGTNPQLVTGPVCDGTLQPATAQTMSDLKLRPVTTVRVHQNTPSNQQNR